MIDDITGVKQKYIDLYFSDISKSLFAIKVRSLPIYHLFTYKPSNRFKKHLKGEGLRDERPLNREFSQKEG